MAKKTVAAKKRNVKVDANGQLHVHSSFNNIIVSLANSEGQIISWSSAGKMGFRGSKKNTPYAAQMAACLLYTSPSPRDGLLSRMPSSA